MEIRPGEGGEDAEVFAAQLEGIFLLFCRSQGIPVTREKEKGRKILLEASRGFPEELLALAGVHRIQRIPPNDSRGRRHTSTATVALLNKEQRSTFELCDEDLKVQTYRGSGAGGQHRNKTDSAVRLTHLPSEIVVCCERERSQWQNLQLAKKELLYRLQQAQNALDNQRLNRSRVHQIVGADRSQKDWTWNTQRNVVICHTTGKQYRLNRLLKGRLSETL